VTTNEPEETAQAPREQTRGQKEAIRDMIRWFVSAGEQVFTLAGLAGTGKTWLIKHFISETGLGMSEVVFCAYTGKASLVMTQKGTPGSTIHSVIYEVRTVHEYDEEGKVTKTKKEWVRRPFLDPMIKLIVIDEASMVPSDIMADLKAYGIRMLLVGDHGQLPPVKDFSEGKSRRSKSGYDHLMEPDARLTEIVRQEEGNPIIWLSKLAREGRPLPYGTHGGRAGVIRKAEMTEKMLLSADCVIVAKNDTRRLFNAKMRHALGRAECLLPAAGDKMICLRNDWNTECAGTPMINGLVGTCVEDVYTVDEDARFFVMDFVPDFFTPEMVEGGNYFQGLKVNLDLFEPPEHGDPSKRHLQFDYGYALTCHKAQGSEYPKVLVYSEMSWGDDREKRAWLYTALTRASRKVIVAQ
jgi:exodeoxyribonuclease-5